MKFLFAVLFTTCSALQGFAQKPDSTRQMAEALEKLFTWETENAEKGKLMFLDVSYQHGDTDSTEFLTITVAQEKGAIRPAFISVIVPDNVRHSDGLFIKFAKTVVKDGEQNIELEKADPVRISFESCDDGICTARMINGLTPMPNGKNEDVFRKFISFDHVFFLGHVS